MMRTATIARLTAVTFLTPALLAMTSAGTMTMQPGSKLWVSGTSSVRSFECKATEFDATVSTIGAGTAMAIANGSKGVSAVEVTVPSMKLDCGNGTMTDHMRKAIKAKDAPSIAFKLSGYELAKSATGTTVDMKGTLTLGGTTKPVSIQALAKAEGGLLHVTGTHALKMTEYGLKPPSLMMGTMKVNENVKVNFDLLLKD